MVSLALFAASRFIPRPIATLKLKDASAGHLQSSRRRVRPSPQSLYPDLRPGQFATSSAQPMTIPCQPQYRLHAFLALKNTVSLWTLAGLGFVWAPEPSNVPRVPLLGLDCSPPALRGLHHVRDLVRGTFCAVMIRFHAACTWTVSPSFNSIVLRDANDGRKSCLFMVVCVVPNRLLCNLCNLLAASLPLSTHIRHALYSRSKQICRGP